MEMEAAAKGGFAGLSPPPPAGATKAPSPQEQMKAIDEALAQSMSPGDVWYCVSAIWHEHWTKFCQQGAAVGEEELHPGRIDNSALAAAEGSPELGRGCVQNSDFVLLPEGAYTLLKEWYGGGPDFPRRVVEVGAARETRVDLYPYFVSYVTADSPYLLGSARARRGAEELMLDTTLPVGRFLAQVCKAAGVEPQYAHVFLVSERQQQQPPQPQEQDQQQPQEQDQQQQPLPPSPAVEDKGLVVAVPARALSRAMAAAAAAAAAGGGTSEETVCELRKVLRAAARDMALTLEDVFFGQKRPQVFVENRRWRFELKQGDAVDAQDSLGDWYDSVVVQVLPPLRPAPPVPAAARAGAPTEPHIQSEEADADGDGEAMDVGGGKDKAAERAAAITAMVTAGAAVGVPAGGLDEEEAEEARQPRVKVHFRCWSPEFDEAFPVTSARLQPLFAQTPDWRRALHVGMVLEVKSPRDRKWYPGRVIEVREAERRVLVASDGDVAPLASAVGGAATASTGKRERWYSFDSDEICRWAVHHKKEPPSPSPSPRGNGNGKRLAASPTSPASSSTALGSATTTTAGAAAATTGAFASAGQGHVLGSGTGAGAGRALSLSVSSSSSSSGGLGGSYYGARPRREPGVVGLSNLGNTCFMNSMLQCLGATQALTEYFLAGRHEAEVNETNPLGSKGMLVRVYVKLLQSMWLGEASPVSPVDFKRVLSQFAPQFAGYQQHDSQELGNFVLDGLHEDLNRVRNKPYVEAKDYEGVPDEALAGELWRQHLLRNDSVVVDRCQGQYKSHMTCPKCGYESVTFDPYLTITLPIPVTSMVKVAFVFHPLPAGSTPIHVAATIPSAGNAAALKTWIAANLCRPRLAVATTATAAATAVDGMAVETEAPKPGAAAPPCAPAPPPAACLNLAETVDKPPRLYKDVPDDTSLSELARPIMTLHVFELERPAAPIALPPLAPAAGGRTWGVVGRSTPSPRPFRSRSASPPRPAAAAGAGGSNGGSNSNSEGPAALVTLQVAKVSPRYIRSNNYDRMGMPVRFALPMGPATTNAAVHTRVWAALQPCLKDDEPLAEGKRPYALMIGNSHAGTMDGAAVPDDAEPFNFRALQHKTLFAVFEAADFMDHVDKDRLEQVDSHPSVRRDSLGDSSGAGGAGRRKAIDLRQCLEKFAERELLGADDLWKCGRCNERLQAYKKMDLYSTPDVLILHLKRFSYVQGAAHSFYSHTREKIEDLVRFPIEGLDLRDAMRGPVDPAAPPVYDLYAVSEHMGGLGGGHYTAVARNFKSGAWYAFNDSFCSPIDPARVEETVVTPRAYVLFYRRRQGSLRWGGAQPPAVPLEPKPTGEGKGDKDGDGGGVGACGQPQDGPQAMEE